MPPTTLAPKEDFAVRSLNPHHLMVSGCVWRACVSCMQCLCAIPLARVWVRTKQSVDMSCTSRVLKEVAAVGFFLATPSAGVRVCVARMCIVHGMLVCCVPSSHVGVHQAVFCYVSTTRYLTEMHTIM